MVVKPSLISESVCLFLLQRLLTCPLFCADVLAFISVWVFKTFPCMWWEVVYYGDSVMVCLYREQTFRLCLSIGRIAVGKLLLICKSASLLFLWGLLTCLLYCTWSASPPVPVSLSWQTTWSSNSALRLTQPEVFCKDVAILLPSHWLYKCTIDLLGIFLLGASLPSSRL